MKWIFKILMTLFSKSPEVEQVDEFDSWEPKIVRFLLTKNFSSRGSAIIDTFIIHSMYAKDYPGREYDPEICIKVLSDYGVSAHYVIDREGVIYEVVLEKYKAWHAGKSILNGQAYVNRRSIGVEVVGRLDEPYTDKQYKSIVWLGRKAQREHPIPLSNFAGHDKIAPGRKKDPGTLFDWDLVKSKLAV